MASSQNQFMPEKEIYKEEFTVGRIVKEAWKIYKKDFGQIFELVLAVAAGKFLMVVLVVLFSPLAKTVGDDVILKFTQGLDAVIGMVLLMAVAWRVKASIDGRAVDFSGSLSKGFSRWPAAIVTDLLKCVFLLAPFALFFVTAATGNAIYLALFFFLMVPAIIWAVYWFFSTYAVLFRNLSGMDALAYSRTVVKGRAGRVFGYAFVIGLLVMVAGAVAAIPLLLAEELISKVPVFLSIPLAFAAKIAVEIIEAYYYAALAVFFINFDATKGGGKSALTDFSRPKSGTNN